MRNNLESSLTSLKWNFSFSQWAMMSRRWHGNAKSSISSTSSWGLLAPKGILPRFLDSKSLHTKKMRSPWGHIPHQCPGKAFSCYFLLFPNCTVCEPAPENCLRSQRGTQVWHWNFPLWPAANVPFGPDLHWEREEGQKSSPSSKETSTWYNYKRKWDFLAIRQLSDTNWIPFAAVSKV